MRRLPRRLGHLALATLQALRCAATFQLGPRQLRYARLIKRSRLLEAEFYASQCPHDSFARRNPILHYLLEGAAAGLDPNPFFDTSFYLEENPDADAPGKNPLVHYIRYGAREGRPASASFDTALYLARNVGVLRSGENPLAHFLARGRTEACADHPAPPGPNGLPFDPAAPLPPSSLARRIMVVDQRMLTPDRDSASVRMLAILTLLRRLGQRVTFVSDKKERLERAEEALRREGVDLLRGREDAFLHLATAGREYGLVLLSRPEIARGYLAAVRELAPLAKIVYDTVDLHFVRFARASEVTSDPVAARQAERFHRMELSNVALSDLTLTVTPQERELLRSEVPGARVEVLPNIHRCEKSNRPFGSRRDLLFIGGFGHAPNLDAVEWFVERILPLVQRELPDIALHVVGSEPPRRLTRLRSRFVHVLGYVPDVAPLFESCRVFVSPLRYGAGMKGKIGQSMSRGVPVVTTSVGAEGMMLLDGENALLADEPAEFANAVIRLYSDESLWSRIACSSLRHIERNFSDEAALERLRLILQAAAPAL